jgi:putative colanic acid biosynthesis acetyltransferase WcaF
LSPKKQKTAYQNPWPLWHQLILMCWRLTWLICCRWTPKFLNPWRILILKLFGAKLSGLPFVHSSARIQIPWNLKMGHRACLGERANVYSLGRVEILEGATVAQEAYLCTGSHDLSDPTLQLVVEKITIETHAFIAVRAMIMPGVNIGKNGVVGAMSVVTKDVPPDQIVAGNPASKIGKRSLT